MAEAHVLFHQHYSECRLPHARTEARHSLQQRRALSAPQARAGQITTGTATHSLSQDLSANRSCTLGVPAQLACLSADSTRLGALQWGLYSRATPRAVGDPG